jgi:hypothetical protein
VRAVSHSIRRIAVAKIPKNRSDKDMMQGFEEETLAEVLLRKERQAEERARASAVQEPPADLARAGLSSAQADELGRALLELKLTLAQEGVQHYQLKIQRKDRQVIITAT